MSSHSVEVGEAWIYKLRGTTGRMRQNARFYFTEKGWREIGRKVITECQRTGQRYRILKVKETDAQVAWRDRHDGYEVALQPKRKMSPRKPVER